MFALRVRVTTLNCVHRYSGLNSYHPDIEKGDAQVCGSWVVLGVAYLLVHLQTASLLSEAEVRLA